MQPSSSVVDINFSDSQESTKTNKHAVVIGAGPCGLLTSILLIRRGWKVTLVERSDKVSSTSSVRRKSWMIGISAPGQQALEEVPGLWEMVQPKVLKADKGNLNIKGWKFAVEFNVSTVDRNEIVAVLTNYLSQLVESTGGALIEHYNSHLSFVKPREKVVCIEKNGVGSRDFKENLEFISYDLLIGADGARSMVRSNLFSQYYKFECSQSGIFQSFKSIYLPCPPEVPSLMTALTLYSGLIEGVDVMFLPAPSGQVNLMLATNDHKIIDERMLTNDPQELCDFFKTLKTLPIDITLESCKDIIESGWYTTQQVVCSPYHLGVNDGSALLLGDAAHATSPSMGLGMNIALADARSLNQLLDKHKENLEVVLPDYSQERMKVGYALTNLSFNSNPLEKSKTTWYEFQLSMRRLGHKLTGGFIKRPARELADKGVPLDEVFKVALEQGDLESIQRSNLEVMKRQKEKLLGLRPITAKDKKVFEQNKLIYSSGIRGKLGKSSS